jgi:hypothetical protein
MKFTLRVTALACGLSFLIAAEPSTFVLWPSGAPGSEGKAGKETVRTTPQGEKVIAGVHSPSVSVYLPSKETATGAAVVIAPGGGHSELWADHEGNNAAQWLSEHGVAGIVLKWLARKAPPTRSKANRWLTPSGRSAMCAARPRSGASIQNAWASWDSPPVVSWRLWPRSGSIWAMLRRRIP